MTLVTAEDIKYVTIELDSDDVVKIAKGEEFFFKSRDGSEVLVHIYCTSIPAKGILLIEEK